MPDIIKTTYYIEITDKRVDLDPPYVWQSKTYKTAQEATKDALVLKEEFLSGNVSSIIKKRNQDYLNSDWLAFYNELPIKRKGIKTNLNIYIMEMNWYNQDEYEIGTFKKT